MEQNRLKSPVVWTSIAAQVLSLLVLLGIVDTGLSNALNSVVAATLQLLVVLGVLNNPKDGENF